MAVWHYLREPLDTSSSLLDNEEVSTSTSPTSVLSLHTDDYKPADFSTSANSSYEKLSKADLVSRLSEQSKKELVLRQKLQDAGQSLVFYRSAIDNIIDCLGNDMPDVKKWATNFLNVSIEFENVHYNFSSSLVLFL